LAIVALNVGDRVRVDRRTALAWIAFLAIAAVAALGGLDPLYAWIGTPERHFGWLTWLLCALLFGAGQQLDRRGVAWLAAACAVSMGVAGAWALSESAGWEPLALVDAGTRAVGPLGSSAFLGAAAVLLGPVGAVAAWRWRPAGGVIVGALAGGALVASGARAAWVGAIFVVAALALSRRAPLRVLVAAIGAGVVGALVLGVAGRLPDVVSDRDGGARGRLDEWHVAARVIAAHPIGGVGPEGYRIDFGRRVDAGYERRHGRDPLPDRAHSAPLDVATTAGVPGALAYVVLLALVGRAALAAARSQDALLAATAIGLIGYAAQSLLLFPLAELDPLAWLLAGVVVARSGTGRAIDVARPGPARIVAAALAVAALTAGVLDVIADREAKTILAALADDRLPKGTTPRQLRPDQLRYRLLAARAASARATPSGIADALRQIDGALDLSPHDPVALTERAGLLLDRAVLGGGQSAAVAAVTAWREILRHDPNNGEAWLQLSRAEALARHPGRAAAAGQKAKRLGNERDGT
jgi:O-antigen ligase